MSWERFGVDKIFNGFAGKGWLGDFFENDTPSEIASKRDFD